MRSDEHLHLTHWGALAAATDGRRLTRVSPWEEDPEPSPLLANLSAAQHHPTRVDQPYVRRGWLRDGPGPSARRGRDQFVAVDWDTALDRVAGELRRVYERHGADAVFGGSYGWASAGRFHHAQSQVHRFLNTLGGYVASVGNYSYGAAQTLLPQVVGDARALMAGATSWSSIAEHTDLLVAFGGLPAKNASVSPGGVGRHDMHGWLERARSRGAAFVLVSPIRDDLAAAVGAQWLAPRPGTDVAIMLALAHVLATERLHDAGFLASHCVGWEEFEGYLLGHADGLPKCPEWAAGVSGVPAPLLRSLARRMARGRTMIAISWSLQRQRFGEQPLWMGIVLAAMLGQIGLPGGGFGHGYAGAAYIGRPQVPGALPALRQGENPVKAFIPVARTADMLLRPGATIPFDGQKLTYPDIRLVYWCGGNPFHHHQDLRKLRRAFERPDSVIVHEQFWTATARHADIVLPATMSIERDDIGGGRNDRTVFAMRQLTAPHGCARDDYAIFGALAAELGTAARFTEGRTARAWIEHLYGGWRDSMRAARREPQLRGFEPPAFERFWREGRVTIPGPDADQVLLAAFRRDPARAPLPTPSGRIEIVSETIRSYGCDDCGPHPAWRAPSEWLGSPRARVRPFHLIANQPATRLHSQLDVGAVSQGAKVHGREPLRMNADDARRLGLRPGEVVKVASDRGWCLAGLVTTYALRSGVVELATGAWYDPDADGNCVHGNPNVLTADVPTSQLSQACAGGHALVSVERFHGPLPPLTVLHAARDIPARA